MDKDFKAKVEAHFVIGAKEHAQELNIMYVQAEKQKAEQEKQAAQGPKISVEEIVVGEAQEQTVDVNGVEIKPKEEDFVL